MGGDASWYTIGDARITRIFELTLDGFTPASLFSNWDPKIARDHPEWLPSQAMNGDNLVLSVHGWLIKHDGRTILVDTGVGSNKSRPEAPYFDDLAAPFLDNLAAAGVEADDVDFVLSTHLHVDHVGWNTRRRDGRWVPTFPKARYIFSRAEHAFFTQEANLTQATRTSFQAQADSVLPIIEAGLADMIAVEGSSPVPGFTFYPTPGHSPDHASIGFSSRGETALFVGDVVHHPVEIFQPDLMTIFDRHTGRVRASRDWALARAADTQALVFSAHFPKPSAGRVERRGSGFAWRFI